MATPEVVAAGSSPLTRGKRVERDDCLALQRLIPAHAGKTLGDPRRTPGRPAHPRSRGENLSARSCAKPRQGSSPLTRGKLEMRLLGRRGLGLIPAHAGKTINLSKQFSVYRAHPRSRGENYGVEIELFDGYGSSPLTRGKHSHGLPRIPVRRLIPAHAGKTVVILPIWRSAPAHPRSRGENRYLHVLDNAEYGSSPLPRGKPP